MYRSWAPWLVLSGALLLLARVAAATSLYALLDTGELYASHDSGATWVVQGTLPVNDGVGIAAGATASDLYLVTRAGLLYRSTDGGVSWTATGALTASDVATFTIAPAGALVALTRTGTVFASMDGGASFSALAALVGSDWVSMTRGPLGRLYALTESGQVAESRDQGATWTTVGVITTSNAVAIHRLGDELFVLARTGEIYRSATYGVTWIPVGSLTSSSMGSLADVGGSLIAAAAEGEVASSPNGSVWSWIGSVNQMSVAALGNDTPLLTGVDVSPTPPRLLVRAPQPNPGTTRTGSVFTLQLGVSERVVLRLYDAMGRLMAERHEVAPGGEHSFRWVPNGVAAGAYFVHFETSTGRIGTVRWTLVR